MRSKEQRKISIDGEDFEVEVLEFPFREGVELQCEVDGEVLRVGDRGLGMHEAERLLKEMIRSKRSP